MAELVGIAKLAAEAPSLEAKKRVEYFELPARSLLAKCDSERVPFGWSINPYRGCEFGCKYCYARYTHEFMELQESEQFERKIFAKNFNRYRFRDELRKLRVGESIAIGSATDPYQPAERRFGVTRRVLEVFAEMSGFRIGIITKSDLIARDVELLQEVGRRHDLTASLTITTLDKELARLLEPMAPRPDLRLSAVRALVKAGVRAMVSCSPVLPLINDSEENLDAVAKAAATAGATRFFAGVVFLKPCARQVFLPFLEQHYPALVRKYRERFEKSAYLRGSYPEMIAERVLRVRKRYGLDGRVMYAKPELWPVDSQLNLFSEALL